MPRKSRIISSSGIYHIIIRSVNQQIIFEEESDYYKFIYILSDSKVKFDVDIYAYCLMDNHVHLLLYAPSEKMAGFFQSAGARFVKWYNSKYKRYGNLFQDRYHSKPVENEAYYLKVLMYIHENPVKAGVCRTPSEYRWSSYNAFYGEKNLLVNTDFTYRLFGSRERFIMLIRKTGDVTMCDEKDENNYEVTVGEHYVTDERAMLIFHELAPDLSIFDASSMPKVQRNELIRKLVQNGLTRKQISRLLGISIRTVTRITE